jgi:Peptidase A4 family
LHGPRNGAFGVEREAQMLKLRPMCIAGVLAISAMTGLAGAAQAALRSQFAAGYQAQSRVGHRSFQFVAATWTVPQLTCDGAIATGGSDGDSYFYVALASGRFGAGHAGAPGSEQVGVRELCLGTVPAYAAYVVMNGAYEVEAAPRPGDVISASVSYRAGRYRFALHDRGAGGSFSLSAACGSEPFGGLASTCGRTAAQVAVGTGLPGLTLARYGTATFSHVTVIDAAGHRGSLALKRHWKVSSYDEYRGSRLLASVSRLSHRGRAFSGRWRHS